MTENVTEIQLPVLEQRILPFWTNRTDRYSLVQNSVLWQSKLKSVYSFQLSYYFDLNPVWYYENDFAFE